MSAQYILHLVAAGREIRRPPLVGMNFLHERRLATRSSPASQRSLGLVKLLVDRFARPQRDFPRRSIALRVFTPSGRPAVRMCCR
jgi:hypothetical protein